MILIEAMLLVFLVAAAIAACTMKHLLGSVIVFTSYGLTMSLIWVLLQSPDLAITEAAVGAGVSSILFFVVLKRIRVMETEYEEEKQREEARRENASE
jgi:Predicted subunit of the Multisubunit Na+/H+ antiporter